MNLQSRMTQLGPGRVSSIQNTTKKKKNLLKPKQGTQGAKNIPYVHRKANCTGTKFLITEPSAELFYTAGTCSFADKGQERKAQEAPGNSDCALQAQDHPASVSQTCVQHTEDSGNRSSVCPWDCSWNLHSPVPRGGSTGRWELQMVSGLTEEGALPSLDAGLRQDKHAALPRARTLQGHT